MTTLVENLDRRTTTDAVFDQLHDEIASLTLLPGTKLSEGDVARRFGVSRQPVRDAFIRLRNLDLLLIRPQRATEVRKFSMERIAQARFVRLAVEMEVIRKACTVWDRTCTEAIEQNLENQQRSLSENQQEQFHALDYQFHKMICDLGGCSLAVDTIEKNKRKVDRLCVLSLGRENELGTLLEDHRQLAEALEKHAIDEAQSVARRHFARLDDTIADIHAAHAEYFE